MDGLGVGAIVRSAQLMQASTSISAALSALWMSMGDIVRAGQEDARTEALRQSFDWDTVLLRLELTAAQRGAMRTGLTAAGKFNVEAMLARIYKTRIPLSEQVYKTAALSRGWVEARVDRALARGATVAELAKEIRQFVSPTTPGGVSYAARRLARTEINNAYHAVTVGHQEEKPWVTSMKWNLSGSHPTVDVCDHYAKRNHSGLGAGNFPKTDVPRKPHPQCLCYVTPQLLPMDEFVDAFRSGALDGYLAQTYGL